MLPGLLALLACQLVGEIAVRLTGLPIPGPVIGMLVFLVVLQLRRPAADHPLSTVPNKLLSHLQLLFVPAGVGIVVYLAEIRDNALPIAVGLWGSWLLGLVVTGWVVTLLLRVGRR